MEKEEVLKTPLPIKGEKPIRNNKGFHLRVDRWIYSPRDLSLLMGRIYSQYSMWLTAIIFDFLTKGKPVSLTQAGEVLPLSRVYFSTAINQASSELIINEEDEE